MSDFQNQKKIFGLTLKKLREKTNMSQEEFGQKLGKKTTTVSSWENGQSYPSIPVYHQICNLCNCDPNIFSSIFYPNNSNQIKNKEFFLKSDIAQYNCEIDNSYTNAKNSFDEETILITKYRLLDEKQKEYVKALINSMTECNINNKKE